MRERKRQLENVFAEFSPKLEREFKSKSMIEAKQLFLEKPDLLEINLMKDFDKVDY